MKKGKKKQQTKQQPQSLVPKCIIPAGQGFKLVIEAKPNSKVSKIMQLNEQFMGVAIAAPPKQGQANQQLVRFIAETLGVKKNTVYLDKGSKSRHKVACVENQEITIEAIYQKLKYDLEH